MCVTAIHFPLFWKPNIAISETIFRKYVQAFCLCLIMFFLVVMSNKRFLAYRFNKGEVPKGDCMKCAIILMTNELI